jgi:hypothetical protein
MYSAPSGLWDLGSVLRVNLTQGMVMGASQFDVLNGANIAAIGDGSAENWEILQFSEVSLTGPGQFELRGLLRGLAGTDATMPIAWPSGSLFVIIDELLPQIDLPISSRGLARYYRCGSSFAGVSDQNLVSKKEAFNGIGLRPYSVSHLKYHLTDAGDVSVSWIRRTRIDGDSWNSLDAPVSEDSERYSVDVVFLGGVVRSEEIASPSWMYPVSSQVSDGVSGEFEVVVAQLSQSFGAGPSRSILVSTW